jgi:hypothetical protein
MKMKKHEFAALVLDELIKADVGYILSAEDGLSYYNDEEMKKGEAIIRSMEEKYKIKL